MSTFRPSHLRSSPSGFFVRPLVASLAALLPLVGLTTSVRAATPRPTQILAKAASESRTGQIYAHDDGRAPGPLRSEAPRLVFTAASGKTEPLPLKETSAQIRIAGAVAEVEVHQVFENTGTTPIEALYVFPASTRAAVHAMRMKIGARTIEAHIDRKAKARETFEKARAAGQRASLLEEERPNVFTMRVTNIMPKDRIDVTLDYSELLVPEDGTYELVYPTVVGPRYQGRPEAGADPQANKWMNSPTLPLGVAAPYEFALTAHLETGVPLKELSSPSHPIVTTSAGPTSTDVKMNDPAGGNRDFVLRYRLSGDRIETGVLLSPADARDDGAGTFAVMMEPPRAPKRAELPPREYLFLLDVSGSMHGFPLDTAKELMRKLLPQMRPSDSFDVSLFSGAAHVMSPSGSVRATSENIRHALEIIERQQGGGGTELMGGLEMTYRIPKKDPGVSRTVVVVTDGYVGIEAQAYRFVREHLGEANLFAFGIGSSVNRALIEGLARAGLGEPFVVLNTSEAAAQAEKLRKIIEEPVLTHIQVAFKGLETSEVSPSVMPDLLSRRPLILLGQYKGAPNGTVTITGLAGGHTPFRQEIALNQGQVRPANAPLRALWARRWVALLEDEHSLTGIASLEEGITQIGLHYSLLTPFTSFVAVDSEIANRTGAQKNVTQPLPLPEGVSDLASEQEAASAGMMGIIGAGSGYGRSARASAPGIGLGGLASKAPRPSMAHVSKTDASDDKAAARPMPAPPPAAAPVTTRSEEKKAKAGKDEARKNEARTDEHGGFGGGSISIDEGWTSKTPPNAARALLAAAIAPNCPRGQVMLKVVLDAQGRITKVVQKDGSPAPVCVSKWLGLVLPGAQGMSFLGIRLVFGA